jgi:UDP-N-acetylglucosamine 2-epimerase (non-hydrolysing)
MKKVISVVGARPNFMKVAPIHRAFQKYKEEAEHYIVHTGQHYDAQMSDAFFKDLEMPQPAYFLGVGSGSHAEQTAKIMIEFEKVCNEVKPDMVIVVGDVNSTVACSLTAVKMGIKTAHVEGGLRSFDRSMPEEINRLATDAICDYCFITEESALKHLKNEGYPEENIFFAGNTMIDSQKFALEKANKSDILDRLSVNKNDYVLVTIHRPSNVDDNVQLKQLLEILTGLTSKRKIVFPIHPRTTKNIDNFGLRAMVDNAPGLILTAPLG